MKIEEVSVKSLNPAQYNPRVMPEKEMRMLMRGIEEYGMVQPIIVNKKDNLVIGGHQRLIAASNIGMKKVPVYYVDLDEGKAKALNIALNKIHGNWDYRLLKDLLEEINEEDIEVDLTGFDEAEFDKLLEYIPEVAISIDTEVEPRRREIKPRQQSDEEYEDIDEDDEYEDIDDDVDYDEEEDEGYDASEGYVASDNAGIIIDYRMLFHSEPAQAIWFQFMKHLKDAYPHCKIVSDATIDFILEKTNNGKDFGLDEKLLQDYNGR